VVGYQHFRGPCCLHLQGEVARIGKKGIGIGPDWRGAAGAVRVHRWSDPAASATSVRRES